MSDNVIHIDKFVSESAKRTIIHNLKDVHHGKPVSYYCATRGISDLSVAEAALSDLRSKNQVHTQAYAIKHDKLPNISATLYKYNHLY